MGEYKLSYINGILNHKQWVGRRSPPNDQPTQIGYDDNGTVDYMRWHDPQKRLHRVGNPAMLFFGYVPNEVAMEYWIIKGNTHRIDGPAITQTMDGTIIREEWWINGGKIESPDYDEWPLTQEQQIELKLKYG